jgi:hypothetical protein
MEQALAPTIEKEKHAKAQRVLQEKSKATSTNPDLEDTKDDEAPLPQQDEFTVSKSKPLRGQMQTSLPS